MEFFKFKNNFTYKKNLEPQKHDSFSSLFQKEY